MASRVHPRGRPSNEELLQRGAREVLAWLERVETQHLHLVVEYNAKMREMARAVEQHRQEIVQLKERNAKALNENEELRNMCCFLDDERERVHKLVAEWRRFGRYTAAILSHELNTYNQKLTQLETRQNHILSVSGFRTEADSAKPDLLEATPASTSSKDQTALLKDSDKIDPSCSPSSWSSEFSRHFGALQHTTTASAAAGCLAGAGAMSSGSTAANLTESAASQHPVQLPQPSGEQRRRSIAENVGDAFKVLEVHEQLESDPMSDREKALIRDMCNVVWNKLEQHYSPTVQQIAACCTENNSSQPASSLASVPDTTDLPPGASTMAVAGS